MKHTLLSSAFAVMALALASCGGPSMEDRMVTYLAETICMAEEAYKAIDATKTQVSEMSVQDLLQKTDEISKKIDGLKTSSFGSEQQLTEARESIKDKKAVAERAVAQAKATCRPSEASIQQATRDYQ